MMNSYTRQGLTFDVIDGGPPGGETVVLLHGFPANATSWNGLSEYLHRAGFRTLAPDQRGYSTGARPKGRWNYRTNLLVDDVVALLDTAGVASAHLIGHDWGGGVAWQMATRNPDRVKTLTSLSTPHPRALIASLLRSKQALHSYYMLAFQLPWLPEHQMLQRRSGTNRLISLLKHSGLDASTAEGYAGHLAAPGALTSAINWYRAIPLSKTPSQRPVERPTLYVWGEQDEFLGETAARLTERYVSGTYRFVPLQASHWLPENNANVLAPMIIEHLSGSEVS
jgi:pimeloyl-ACP methyl ester carboxylesterase